MACTATSNGVPCGAALHGDKDARDHENERDAKFSHLLGNRDRRKLRGYGLPVAELGDRTVLSRRASIRWICCNAVPSVGRLRDSRFHDSALRIPIPRRKCGFGRPDPKGASGAQLVDAPTRSRVIPRCCDHAFASNG